MWWNHMIKGPAKVGVFVQYHLVGERTLLFVAKMNYNAGTLTTLSGGGSPPLTVTYTLEK